MDIQPLVEDQHPLKQGLKHKGQVFCVLDFLVEDQHPLKQGLKHNPESKLYLPVIGRRPTSTKTRIETPYCQLLI